MENPRRWLARSEGRRSSRVGSESAAIYPDRVTQQRVTGYIMYPPETKVKRESYKSYR